jgi:UDP-3-O-[3-hydroxymyristoyl] glucosamine N-acyltransferase
MDIKITVREVAALIKGTVEGNPDAILCGFSKLEGAEPGALSFLSNPAYEPFIYSTGASAVIVSDSFKPSSPITTSLIRVSNPYMAVAMLLEKFNPRQHPAPGIHPLSFIDDSAKYGENISLGAFSFIGKNAEIGKNVVIYPQVFIGDNCVIGDETILYPGVVVNAGCHVGNFCTIHAGCVVGSDGFGFAPSETDNYRKVPQTGNVVIEDYVEIGANTAIDRATLGSTIIRKGVKLDNLIQIAHNVEIGGNTVIAAQSGVSGSSKVGENCMIGGQVGIVGHIKVADGTKIAAQSGVASDIEPNNLTIQGSPAFEIGKYRRCYITFKNLPELTRRIEELEARLREIEEKNR